MVSLFPAVPCKRDSVTQHPDAREAQLYVSDSNQEGLIRGLQLQRLRAAGQEVAQGLQRGGHELMSDRGRAPKAHVMLAQCPPGPELAEAFRRSDKFIYDCSRSHSRESLSGPEQWMHD